MNNRAEEVIDILLIEESPEYVRLLDEALNSQGTDRFTIIHADRLSTGLRYLAERSFKVVLSDLVLPDSAGFDTFAILHDQAADTPIILLTSLQDENLAIRAVRAGAQDCLIKGQFRPPALMRAIYYAIERHKTKVRFQKISLIDDLTELYNRRGFYALAEQQLKLAGRAHQKLTLILADLDNMKFINDNFGHAEGDRALQSIAKLLKTSLRGTDIVSRLDGDEFTVLAVGASEYGAVAILKRLHENIDRYNRNNGRYRLSLSTGSAQYEYREHQTLEDLIAEADKALYKNKRQNLSGITQDP
jgi:two-component system cell cycle response regulator